MVINMEGMFIQILNMGYQAGIVICFVIVARLILRFVKAPKKYAYALWVIPFIRMMIPVSWESIFSLLPQKSSPIRADIGLMEQPQINTSIEAVNAAVAQILPPATATASVNPMQIYLLIVQWIWLTGVVLLLIYSVGSYLWLKRKLHCRIYVRENIYYTDYIQTPFVMGIRKPCIYLPYALAEQEMEFVIAHEETHIRRHDHVLKMLAFLVVSVYWFNPLAWVAFILMGRDMEMSCDEAVMKTYGEESKRKYAATLLNLTTGRGGLAGIPLAFGEGNTKNRIKNIMNYKKTVTISVIIAMLLFICLTIGLLTNPKSEEQPDTAVQMDTQSETMPEENTQSPSGTEVDTPFDDDFQNDLLDSGLYALQTMKVKSTGGVFTIFNNSSQQLTYGAYYKLQREEDGAWVDVPYVIDDWGFEDIGYLLEANSSAEMRVDWEWLYGKLPEGLYMIIKYLNIDNNSGGYDTLSLSSAFEISGK